MRLCFLADASSVHTRRWVEFFAQRGHTVHLFTFSPHDEVPGDVVQHDLRVLYEQRQHVAWPAGARQAEHAVQMASATRHMLQEVRPDIVHAHSVVCYGHLGLLSLCRPLVVSAWGSDIYHHRSGSWRSRALTVLTLRAADICMGDSADLVNKMVALGANRARTALVYFGVDTRLFRAKPDREALRARYGYSPRDTVILSPRGMRALYNIESLLRAMPILEYLAPNPKLMLRDYGIYGDYRQRIESVISELQLQGSVRIIERVPYGETVDMYNAADVVVTLADTDSSPVSLLEAMACGAIPVAGDITSMREWIQDGVNGYLVDPKSPAAIARGIAAVVDLDPGTRAAWAARNRRLVEERADVETCFGRAEALYAQLAAQGRPGQASPQEPSLVAAGQRPGAR